MKRILMLIVALLIAAPSFGQQRNAQKFTVSFEAGLVMKAGNVRKLPRHDFYLLNRALTQTDVDTITVFYNIESLTTGLTKKEKAPFPDFVCWDIKARPEVTAFCNRFKAGLIATAVTDFDGMGSFTVPPGTYYLVSHADAGLSQAVWNVRIVVDSNQKLILDNRNAAAIKDIQQAR